MFVLRNHHDIIFDIVSTVDEAINGLWIYDRRTTPWYSANRLAAGPFRTNAAALAEVFSGDWYGLSAEDLPGVTVEHIGDKVRATVEIIAPDGRSGATRRKSFDNRWHAYAFVQDLLDQAAAGDDDE